MIVFVLVVVLVVVIVIRDFLVASRSCLRGGVQGSFICQVVVSTSWRSASFGHFYWLDKQQKVDPASSKKYESGGLYFSHPCGLALSLLGESAVGRSLGDG